MEPLSINCLVSSDGPGQIFTVEIPPNKNVAILKDFIKEKNPARFKDIDATAIQLFKLKVSLAPDEASRLLNPLRGDAVQELSLPLDEISDHFHDLAKRHVHVIVLAPTVQPKRPRSPSPSIQSQLKRTKLAAQSPSVVAQPPNYQAMQATPNQKLLDDRPVPDTSIAPLALLYPGFGIFDDIVAGRESVDTQELQIIKPGVVAFATAMSATYQREDERRDKGLGLLNNILASGHGLGPYNTLTSASIGSVRSDGRSVGPGGVPLTVVEFKNNLTGIKADPCVEAVAYVTHLHMAMEKNDDLFRGWRLPCLGITIVGHTVTFYAIVLLWNQYRVVGLTPTLSCLQSASNGRDLDALHLAFAATIKLRTRMLADIESHSKTPPSPIPRGAHHLPAISQLRKHGAPGEYVKFQVTEYFSARESYRELYVADMLEDTAGSSTILVKFSRTYSVGLHDHCFRAGHAPKLLAFEALPGGWYGIAMEYLQNTESLNSAQFEADLTKLVNEFHQEGWVHGDLRDTNIRCRGDDFWIIDFDWGGKDGEAEYPTPYLNAELITGRAYNDLRIRKEDDMRVLRNTLNKCK